MPKELDYQAMGARVREARERRGFTQEQLSEECSLSASHIGHIERGTRTPSLETVFAISCTLGVSLDELVFGSTQPTEAALSDIVSVIHRKEESKAEAFMSVVRVLADHIDEL